MSPGIGQDSSNTFSVIDMENLTLALPVEQMDLIA
jgi:hypothetical protein